VTYVRDVPDLAYKDLCFDANRPHLVAELWRDLLGLELEKHEDGDAVLRGPTPQHQIWFNRVPEPQELKNRVHLDVMLADPQDVPGTTLVREAGEHPWRVLADQDGLQFCAFPLREGASPGAFELIVDAEDPLTIASWWAARLGVPVHDEGKPWVWLEDVPGLPYRYWVFNPVPEPKTVKNRVHWDITLLAATVDDLVAAGASLVRARDEEIRWTILADPEGNEFCAFGSD
jgi:hypothetical protein